MPTLAAISLPRMSGSSARQTRTWAWLVRKVQVLPSSSVMTRVSVGRSLDSDLSPPTVTDGGGDTNLVAVLTYGVMSVVIQDGARSRAPGAVRSACDQSLGIP